MENALVLAVLLCVPAAGAAVSLTFERPRQVLAWTVAWTMAFAFVAVLAASLVFASGPVTASSELFYLDALSALHLLVVAGVFAMSSLFAWVYFGEEERRGELAPRIARRFGALWAASLASMTILLTTNNVAVMWVAVELTTLSTAFLIRLHVTKASLEATWKYLVICSIGIAFAFMGVVLFAAAAQRVVADPQQATMWTSLVGAAASLDPGLARAGFVFVLVGFGTKAGLAPMHSWLPDAHSQAPAPVSAVFSGTLLSSALYVVMRFFAIARGVPGGQAWAGGLLIGFGLLSILIAAAFIVFQRDLKRLLAYSSVEHIGIVALGLGLGPLGAFAALFHTINHSAAKSLGFFAAGALGQKAHTHDMAALRSAAAGSAAWRGALIVSLLSLAGLAPFATFLSEFGVAAAAVGSGFIGVAVLLLLGLAVAFAGLLRHLIPLGWGGPAPAEGPPAKPRPLDWAIVVLPFAAILGLGLWMPDPLRQLLREAASIAAGGF